MAGLINKIFHGTFLEDDAEDDDFYDDDIVQDSFIEEEPKSRKIESIRSTYNRSNNTSKIVNINTNVQMEVVVATPESIDEAGEVCDHLKAKKTVIVNIENIERSEAQRISDFLCGACYALDGTVQLISNEIFVIGPVNVDITGKFKEELQANGVKLPYTSMWR